MLKYIGLLKCIEKSDIITYLFNHIGIFFIKCAEPGNTRGGSITVLMTSCLTGLELAV